MSSVAPLIFSNWKDGLPDTLYDIIFGLLSGKDLIRCRRVCKVWETFCTPLLFDKTQLRFYGTVRIVASVSKTVSRLIGIAPPGKRFASFIQDKPELISGWSYLKFQNVQNSDLTTIFTSLTPRTEQRQLTFQNISSLEVSRSIITFESIILLLDMLENLRSFIDTNTFWEFDTIISFWSKSDSQIQEEILEKYASFQSDLTELKISQRDVGREVRTFLTFVGQSFPYLKKLELKIKESRYSLYFPGEHFRYSSVVGILLLQQVDTLKHIDFEWIGHFGLVFATKFYMTFHILSLTDSPILLTHVNLHFEYVSLGNSDFRDILVPFINRLDHLKVLSIKKIVFRSERTELLLQLQPNKVHLLETEISLGLCLGDDPELQFAIQNMTAIQNQTVLCDLVGLFVVKIISPLTESLSQLLPLTLENRFPNVKELSVTHEFRPLPPTRFVDFNIDGICNSFKNLTDLTILDGRRFLYLCRFRIKKQYDTKTLASLTDIDVQLILKTLLKLKRLRLRMRMVELSDLGMTGLSHESLCRLNQSKDIRKQRLRGDDQVGFSFANLKDLEEVILEGLHQKVSNVSAFHAFNNLPRLKKLILCGDTSLTSVGRSFLRSKLPKSGGCFLRVN